MSTAPFPGTVRPAGQPDVQHLGRNAPQSEEVAQLTIRRISKTHHGRTLQTLGHAAEYLVNSRRFAGESTVDDEEAVRILMRLSSGVFREYAERMKVGYPVHDFLMGCAAWLFE